MKRTHYTKEQYESIFSSKEEESSRDMERDPELSHWHQARELEAHFQVAKVYDREGSWNGLWTIKSRVGPLPTALEGNFTDVLTAITKIKAYLAAQKGTRNDDN